MYSNRRRRNPISQFVQMALNGIGIALGAIGAFMLISGAISTLPPYDADSITNGFKVAIIGVFFIAAGGWMLNLLRR